MKNPFQLSKTDALRLFGTQQALATALGITQPAVGLWPNDRPIPQGHAYRIRYELRPDAFKSDGTLAL